MFDGETMQKAGRCASAAIASKPPGRPRASTRPARKVMDLPGLTLMPGLVEGHSHILLHAYNETPWNDQVAHEGLACASRAPPIICAIR